MTLEEMQERREEIIATTSMFDVLSQYGVKVVGRRCKAICHDGDNLTAKVHDTYYYCYKCDLSMNVFDVTMLFNNCDFKTAFELLGGNDKPSWRTQIKAKKAYRERQFKKQVLIDKKAKLRAITIKITAYRNIIFTAKPFSDEWCYAQNKLPYQIYLLEQLSECEK